MPHQRKEMSAIEGQVWKAPNGVRYRVVSIAGGGDDAIVTLDCVDVSYRGHRDGTVGTVSWASLKEWSLESAPLREPTRLTAHDIAIERDEAPDYSAEPGRDEGESKVEGQTERLKFEQWYAANRMQLYMHLDTRLRMAIEDTARESWMQGRASGALTESKSLRSQLASERTDIMRRLSIVEEEGVYEVPAEPQPLECDSLPEAVERHAQLPDAEIKRLQQKLATAGEVIEEMEEALKTAKPYMARGGGAFPSMDEDEAYAAPTRAEEFRKGIATKEDSCHV